LVTWATPGDITYGTPLSSLQLNATANVPGTFVYSTPAGTFLNAGLAQTLSVNFIPDDSIDYNSSSFSTVINVKQATLQVEVNPVTKVYGQQNPAFNVTYNGLTNGDTTSSLNGRLRVNTSATSASPVGVYSVNATGLTSTNYTITYVIGHLIITPAPLTIIANNQSRTVGQENPTLTATYQGFVNGDTAASLSSPAILWTAATRDSAAGSYPIVITGAASPNYTCQFIGGTISISSVSNPVSQGRSAFVTSLFDDLLLTAPSQSDLDYWQGQLEAGRSPASVATAINRSNARRAVLQSLHGAGMSLSVAFRRALNAQLRASRTAQQPLVAWWPRRLKRL
jgi:hypothetical protein